AENSLRATLAQIFGGGVLLFGLYFTWRSVRLGQRNIEIAQENLKVTEEGKLTERLGKAVEMLGNKVSLNVRLGGVYALERIARDSQKDHWTVMEVLTAFVREHSEDGPPGQPGSGISATAQRTANSDPTPVRTDDQAAVAVIGRRKWTGQEEETQRLD